MAPRVTSTGFKSAGTLVSSAHSESVTASPDPVCEHHIAPTHGEQEHKQNQDPPYASQIGQFLRKANCSERTSPVQEEVRIILAFGKLPSPDIPDPGIDGIEQRRQKESRSVSEHGNVNELLSTISNKAFVLL